MKLTEKKKQKKTKKKTKKPKNIGTRGKQESE